VKIHCGLALGSAAVWNAMLLSERRAIFPRQINGIIFEQAIVWQRFNRCEIAMRNITGTFETTYVI
jgi:hypothetical protein